MQQLLRNCVILCLLIAAPARATDLTIFAAASLQTALDRIAADWSAASGDKVTPVYDGSARLARQIAAGAPADIFVSASPDWMDFLATQDAIDPATRRDILGNALVLIAPADADFSDPLADLAGRLGTEKLAMATVDSVPAGIYGKAALTSLGLWLSVEPQVVQTDNVRGALALVALGEAAMGIVYASDAKAEPRVHVIASFDAATHPPIIYPAALTRSATTGAQAFLDYLSAPPAQAVFAAEGFTVAPQ